MHPFYFSGIRQLTAGLLFLLFFLFTGKAKIPSLKEAGYLIMMSVLMFVLSNGFTTWAMKYLNSGLGAVLGAISPLFIAILEWAMGSKNKLNKISVLGLLLGFIGVAIIFFHHLGDFMNKGFRIGIFLSLSASLFWSLGTVITARTILTLNRYYSLGWQMFLSGVIMLVFCYTTNHATPLQQIPLVAWMYLAYMAVFGSIIAFGAFVYTLHNLPTALASIYAYINPIVAVILGYYILQEAISISLGIGAAVTLLGVYLVNRGFKKNIEK